MPAHELHNFKYTYTIPRQTTYTLWIINLELCKYSRHIANYTCDFWGVTKPEHHLLQYTGYDITQFGSDQRTI